ncbi:MAG: alkylation response protein AidB-like acyl-CoA dehydrogenase [Myxococcota bacterium]|jgi:alkylation response protein AidB-like acyl-CoA dehydrogenase
MGLILSEDQLILRDMAKSFCEEKSPVERMRVLRDTKDETGFSRDLWKEMGELGWAGILFPESVGGAEMGYGELGVVLTECGRVLAPEPFLSTVLLGGNAILLGGSEPLQKELLPDICTGERIVSMAFQEKGRFAPYAVETSATRDGGSYKITGEKLYVLDGHVADQIVTVARTSGKSGDRDGLSLFVVDANTAGVSIQRTEMVDGRNAAHVSFKDAAVDASRLLGTVDAGADVLDSVFDRATIGLCAEMLGTFEEAFERTLEYLKTREQFGVKIGSFQGLRHRAAEMFGELEFARSVVLDALSAIDEGRDDIAACASAAKARCSDVAFQIGGEAVQMHGGIGMTDEEEIGLFFKRLKCAEVTLGDAIYHHNRFASLRGY